MPATTLAWNDPRVMNRVAEQYKQLRAQVDKLRALQKQVEQNGTTLTSEQRAQLELLPGALEDLRELREGRMPAHPIALLTAMKQTTTTATSGTIISPAATTTTAVTTGKKAKRSRAKAPAAVPAVTEATHEEEEEEAIAAVPDNTTTTTTSVEETTTTSTTKSSKKNKKKAKGGKTTISTEEDIVPEVDDTPADNEEEQQQEEDDKAKKSKKKNKKAAAEEEEEAATVSDADEDDPRNKSTWLRRLSTQATAKARNALLEEYIEYYMSSPNAITPAALVAAEKKLKAAMECKRRILQCYEQGKPPSKKQLDTIEQLPALRKQVAQCARQVKLEAEKAKAELLAAYEAQQQQQQQQEAAARINNKHQQEHEEADKTGSGSEQALMTDTHTTTTAAAETTNALSPARCLGSTMTLMGGSSTGLSTAITTGTTAPYSHGSAEAIQAGSSISSLVATGEDEEVLVNVKTTEEEGGKEEEEEGVKCTTSPQEEPCTEIEEEGDTNKIPDITPEATTEEGTATPITTTTTMATMTLAEEETVESITADAMLQSVPPAAHITIQSGSEWARVLRYAAPTITGTTISTPLSTKTRTTTSNNDDNGSSTPVATKRRPAGLTINSNFTLRGFYSLIPRSSALAYNAEPTQRNNKSEEESEESREEEQQQEKRSNAGRRLSSASSTSTHTDNTTSQLTSAKQKRHQLMQKLPCMAVAETTPAMSYYRLQLGLNDSPDQQQQRVNNVPSGKEVDEHTRRLLSALTATTSSNVEKDKTLKKDEKETCGLRGRPMLRARLAADWAAVQAALPNELPGMSLLACCDHTAHKTNEANTITTTTTAPVVHANTPLVSWLVSYSPRCGPLAGHCVPLELVFLPSYPFTAPRLFSLVSLPHPHLVLAQGGRANLLYLPTSTQTNGTSSKNEISRSQYTLSLPASPCSPTTTTTSLVSSSVLDLLARVPAFFEGAEFAEMTRALGAEAFAAQLAQARLALGKVWLALSPALVQRSETQKNETNHTMLGAQQSMRWSWRNGPYLTLSEDTAKDAENKSDASAEGTAEEKPTSKPQVVLYNNDITSTATGVCGVRGSWRGCWGHLFYTLPSTVNDEETQSTTSEHTRLPAGHELHVELRRYITESDDKGTPSNSNSETARVSALRLMQLPWTALICEGDGTAGEGTTHWAQQLLMQANNEDNSDGDEGSAKTPHAYWSLPSSAWSACNTSEHTAKVCIKTSQAETTTCLWTEMNEDNTTTLTLPNTSRTSDAEVTGCAWALMLDVPPGQTVSMTVTLRPSASCKEDTNGVKEQEQSAQDESNETEISTVHGMLLSVPFGFSAAATTSALLHPLHIETTTLNHSSAVNTKESLGAGLCESTLSFYEDYYIPRCLGPLRGSIQLTSKTSSSLEISESEFYLYRQLTPSSLQTFNSQKEEQECNDEKGLSVSCHDYLVVPPENVLRRALLQLEPSTNSKANVKTATVERSRNVASRAERERHLREDYFWGLRVLFLPCMSPTVCDYVLSHTLASKSITPTDSINAAYSLVKMLQPSEHEALYRFMQSCVQLYRQPAASTAYAVPLQPLHVLHFLSLTLWHVLPLQEAAQTEMKPSCSAAQHVVVLTVALAAKQQSLRDVCHRVVCEYADTLFTTSTKETTTDDKEGGNGSDESGVCTLLLQMPYFPLPSTTKQTTATAVAETEQKAVSQTSTAQRAASRYRFVLNYLVSRLEGSLSGSDNMDKATREAAAAHYLTRLQCAALYLALQCVHQLSSETDSETCVDVVNDSADAQGSEEKATSRQRAGQILNELQRDEEEGKEMGAEDEKNEARRTLRYIHQCVVPRAATS